MNRKDGTALVFGLAFMAALFAAWTALRAASMRAAADECARVGGTVGRDEWGGPACVGGRP